MPMKPTMTARTAGLAMASTAIVLALSSCNRTAATAAEKPPRLMTMQELAQKLRGVVAYEHKGGIYSTRIGETNCVMLAETGTYPRWSPDGRHVAFVRGTNIMRMASDGSSQELLATVSGEKEAVAYHPNGREVLFTDNCSVKSIALETRKVTQLVRSEGIPIREIDITADGSCIAATVWRKLAVFDTRTGVSRVIVRGCSTSLSPDGKLVTNNRGGHRRLQLRSRESGEVMGVISGPDGRMFDNQFWSNHQDWVASMNEDGEHAIYVHHVPDNACCQVTFVGWCDRPDLFVERSE